MIYEYVYALFMGMWNPNASTNTHVTGEENKEYYRAHCGGEKRVSAV